MQQVYIHLENGGPPSKFARFAPLVKPVHGAIQLALALYQDGLVDARAVREAKEQTRLATLFQRLNLDALLSDAVERKLISPDKAKDLNL